MKSLLCAVLMAGAAAPVVLANEPATADLVWCGLDYSQVRMIGTEDFRDPEAIFPAMPVAWNNLFIKEMVPKLEKIAPGLRTDTQAVQPGNAKLDARCILREDGAASQMVTPSHLDPSKIAPLIQAYELKAKQGLGLVFVMDRLVKAQQTACLYVVFFDIGSRKVIAAERVCAKAGGAGFRNYWFGPVKRVVKDLKPQYLKAKAAR